MKKSILFALCLALLAGVSHATIIISQYYEGPSTNKWIELYNTDTVNAVDLSTLAVGLWTNAAAEGYKSNTAPNNSLTLSGTILAGGYFLLGNTGNTTPSYASANTNNNTVINFNGNDSIAIYSAGTFSTANIIDAIGFTNSGNEGADKSFVRIDPATAGWNTTALSNVTSFAAVWQQVTNAQVDTATTGTPERLESKPVPEPSALLSLAGGLGLLCGIRRMRTRLSRLDDGSGPRQ